MHPPPDKQLEQGPTGQVDAHAKGDRGSNDRNATSGPVRQDSTAFGCRKACMISCSTNTCTIRPGGFHLLALCTEASLLGSLSRLMLGICSGLSHHRTSCVLASYWGAMRGDQPTSWASAVKEVFQKSCPFRWPQSLRAAGAKCLGHTAFVLNSSLMLSLRPLAIRGVWLSIIAIHMQCQCGHQDMPPNSVRPGRLLNFAVESRMQVQDQKVPRRVRSTDSS